MADHIMVLPATDFSKIRVVKVPDDISKRDALRHATALIASVQEDDPDSTWEDILPALEDNGYYEVDFSLGPELD
ncbi:MAG: hypothetical protein KAS48_01590 [Gammaproteobacteria bacterium]|nr:hypothetical protein [Gammaproteobacteria bacterium]MCK5092870.1 hypothetical protein [Gammaproteobacteria bacterium]